MRSVRNVVVVTIALLSLGVFYVVIVMCSTIARIGAVSVGVMAVAVVVVLCCIVYRSCFDGDRCIAVIVFVVVVCVRGSGSG